MCMWISRWMWILRVRKCLGWWICHGLWEAGGLNGSFALDGGFDDAGVITGRAEHRRYSSQERAVIVSGGQMSGLIGALGAVGAFVSDEGARQGYAGGFVAVNY